MFVTTEHAKFEKLGLVGQNVSFRCANCNMMYVVNAFPRHAHLADQPAYFAAQLPQFCPCRFVTAQTAKHREQYDQNDKRRHTREGLVIFDLSEEDLPIGSSTTPEGTSIAPPVPSDDAASPPKRWSHYGSGTPIERTDRPAPDQPPA